MAMSVQEIFAQKFKQIQSRLPVKMNPPSDLTSTNFKATLEKAKESANNTNNNTDVKNNYSFQIQDAVSTASSKYKIDPNLVKAIIKAESGFNQNAVSKAGAKGLMQLMPSTAQKLGVDNSFDIEENIDGGTRYLKQNLEKFNGNLKLALAAYNAGPNSVNKYNGIPPYPETKNYVENVLKYYNEYQSK